MRVTVLGSGTAVPEPDRFPAGYLVEHAGRHALVDLGPGVLRRLAQAGVGAERIDTVLLTHYHTDHCADVAALLFALRGRTFAGRPPLRIVGAEGLRALVARLTEAWPWLEPRGYTLELDEIAPGSTEVIGLRVEAIAIEHTAQSLGYRLRSPDGALAAFSGDAIECDALVPLAADADLFVCDSAFPSASPGDGHMTPVQAGRTARRAGVRRLCLTHFYPECRGHDLVAEARAEFDGEVEMARDLQSFELARG